MLVIACNTASNCSCIRRDAETITNSSGRSYSPRIHVTSFKNDKHVSCWDYWNDWNGEKCAYEEALKSINNRVMVESLACATFLLSL